MTEKYLSCSGLGFNLTQIIAALMFSPVKLPNGFGFEDSEIVFTHQGRYAVHLVCLLLNIGKGDEVLCPAYNCGAEIDPFVWAGAKVIFYRIDEHAAIDEEDIIRRITPSTKVVYISHFLGWPQEIRKLAEFCSKKGIFLIEDCALCLFSRGPDNTIGRVGDAAIYSFVKSLPVPDGGALVLNRRAIPHEIKPFTQPKHRNIVLSCLPLLKKWFMNKNKFWQHHEFTRTLLTRSWLRGSTNQNIEIEREMPHGNYFDSHKIGWDMSRLSKGIIYQTVPDRVIETRRRNYQHLQNELFSLQGIQLLFHDLPANVCPLSFPLFVKDRNHWCQKLEEHGILAGGWPSYHRGFDWKLYPEARHLKNDLLTLPVHQYLDLYHMEHIAKCVKSVAGRT